MRIYIQVAYGKVPHVALEGEILSGRVSAVVCRCSAESCAGRKVAKATCDEHVWGLSVGVLRAREPKGRISNCFMCKGKLSTGRCPEGLRILAFVLLEALMSDCLAFAFFDSEMFRTRGPKRSLA